MLPLREPLEEHWSVRVWPQLVPELAEHVVSFLDRNEVAATFRHVNKATAERFRGPQHIVIRLSQPVPPHAFAAHWLAPGATRGLTLDRRKQLVRLVAASGVLPNLQVALRVAGFFGGCHAMFEAAAGTGQLPVCQLLWDCSRSRSQSVGNARVARRPEVFARFACRPSDALASAAGGGHRRVCEWLLAADRGALHHRAVHAAARGGYAALAEWLLLQLPPPGTARADQSARHLASVAHGCDLPALQRTWPRAGPSRGPDPEPVSADLDPIGAAAGSPTPDWAAKVEWLEAQGCPRTLGAAEQAASLPDDGEALARLTWLRGRGCPVGVGAVPRWRGTPWARYPVGAVPRGRGARRRPQRQHRGAAGPAVGGAAAGGQRRLGRARRGAARGGHLAALQVLHAAGLRVHGPTLAGLAAQAGQLQVLHAAGLRVHGPTLAGLAAQAGQLQVLYAAGLRVHGPTLAGLAAQAGQLQVLHAAGLRVHGPTLAGLAAQAGQLQVLAWLLAAQLAEPVVLGAQLFTAAAESGSVELLAWLRQRGCPWDSDAYSAAAAAGCEAALEWLAERGCPMEESGQPYIEACCNGDLASARCLRRLGVPWGPDGRVFLEVARNESNPAPLALLRWLLREGCPAGDYEEVEEGLADSSFQRVYQVLGLLEEHQGRRQPGHGGRHGPGIATADW
ncbi:hypothetical protein GPECTOR_82g261 [Gonium pectorale]|uniref:Uncharacterized protein n=1 Tax=Gonium pectorale TaxID=33097 RepID=A0A150G1K5_GONPE|nr:hypothetical protein GPECTOR_82g261 [Gonium pectorale]|eukprot:KXZ43727.1 hypothetical protein GPECTOR_82g261 [Gonium pectorale]